jgi:hypothetical protein
MHQNLFLNTPDINEYIFYDQEPCGPAVCANALEIVFDHSRHLILPFLLQRLVAWQYAKMHQNLSLTTPEVLK